MLALSLLLLFTSSSISSAIDDVGLEYSDPGLCRESVPDKLLLERLLGGGCRIRANIVSIKSTASGDVDERVVLDVVLVLGREDGVGEDGVGEDGVG